MSLPCAECKGKCCTFPAMSKREFKRIKAVHGFPADGTRKQFAGAGRAMIIIHRDDGTCPYLVDGKCSVYSLRPDTCRKYGVVKEMPCEFLYPERAKQAVDAFMAKAGVRL